jgi:hypothetical protein
MSIIPPSWKGRRAGFLAAGFFFLAIGLALALGAAFLAAGLALVGIGRFFDDGCAALAAGFFLVSFFLAGIDLPYIV